MKKLNKICIIVIAIGFLAANASALESWQQPYDRTESGTVALIHFDEYATGDWIWVESTDNPQLAYFDPYTVNSYITDAAPAVPHSGFLKYYNIDPASPVDRWDGHNRTRSDIMDATALANFMHGPMTIEGWINVDASPADGIPPEGYDFTGIGAVLFSLSGDGAAFQVRYMDDGNIRFSHGEDTTFHSVLSNSQVALNEWHHIMCTRTWADAGGGLADYVVDIYIDGVLDISESWTGPNVDLTLVQNKRIYIGGNGLIGYPVLDGSVDEVRLSSRIVPEPATMSLLILGAGLLLGKRR